MYILAGPPPSTQRGELQPGERLAVTRVNSMDRQAFQFFEAGIGRHWVNHNGIETWFIDVIEQIAAKESLPF